MKNLLNAEPEEFNKIVLDNSMGTIETINYHALHLDLIKRDQFENNDLQFYEIMGWARYKVIAYVEATVKGFIRWYLWPQYYDYPIYDMPKTHVHNDEFLRKSRKIVHDDFRFSIKELKELCGYITTNDNELFDKLFDHLDILSLCRNQLSHCTRTSMPITIEMNFHSCLNFVFDALPKGYDPVYTIDSNLANNFSLLPDKEFPTRIFTFDKDSKSKNNDLIIDYIEDWYKEIKRYTWLAHSIDLYLFPMIAQHLQCIPFCSYVWRDMFESDKFLIATVIPDTEGQYHYTLLRVDSINKAIDYRIKFNIYWLSCFKNILPTN